MKILVDELPESAGDCIFSEYDNRYRRHDCMLQHGLLYTKCDLECGRECPYLKKGGA